MGSGWNQAKAQFGTHRGGSGGFVGQVNPRGGDQVDSIHRGFNSLNQGIQNFAEMQADKDRLGMQKQQFAQDMNVAEQKLNLAKDNNELAQLKYASQQKQQEFDNERKMKEEQRKQVETQLKTANWENKQEVANIFRNNIGAISKTLEEGTYEDLMKSDEYQLMVSGLASVDPEGALSTINNVLVNRAKEMDNQKAVATYNIASDIYTSELPEAITMIEQGKSIPEAMEGIRKRVSALAKTGNIDHKAMTEQLKSIMTTLKAYKKNSASVPLQSFDEEGNPVDPLMNPGSVNTQVNPITGKVSPVKKSGGDIFDQMIEQKMRERMGR